MTTPPPQPREAEVMSSTQHTANAAHASRELASRDSDGLHARLLWHPNEDVLTVSVDDSRSGHRLDFDVERDRGLDAFYHPYAYAASQSLVRRDNERQPLELRQSWRRSTCPRRTAPR
jgi:hypothetical protein